jgi:simple sugar transport system permease protein
MSLAFLMKNGFNQFIAFIISLGIACIIGLCNGLITLKARIPSFITTLGMMMFIRGILLAVTGGFPIPCKEQTILLDILAGRLVEDFRTSGIWFLLLTLLFAFMLNSTKYGNWVFATGGNKYVAKALGVDIEKVKLINFMLCSLLAGLAGSISLGRFRMVEPLSGSGMELETIAAAVIGGCSLTGGYGSIIGASIGALLVGMIRVGLVLAGAPAYWYQGFIGIILVIAAIINMQVVRK